MYVSDSYTSIESVNVNVVLCVCLLSIGLCVSVATRASDKQVKFVTCVSKVRSSAIIRVEHVTS